MINVIKMDCFRLFKSKSLYVMSGIAVSFTFLIYLLLFVAAKMQPDKVVLEKSSILELIHQMMSSGIVFIFIGVFAALFMGNEIKYLKNIASSVSRRWYFVVAKIVPFTIFIVIEFLVIGLSTLIFALMFQMPIEGSSVGDVANYFLLEWLLHLGLAMVVAAAIQLFRSKMFGMMVALILALNFDGLIAMIIELLVKRFAEGFSISKYLLFTNMSEGYSAVTKTAMTVPYLVAISYLLVFTVLASVLICKKDIK